MITTNWTNGTNGTGFEGSGFVESSLYNGTKDASSELPRVNEEYTFVVLVADSVSAGNNRSDNDTSLWLDTNDTFSELELEDGREISGMVPCPSSGSVVTLAIRA